MHKEKSDGGRHLAGGDESIIQIVLIGLLSDTHIPDVTRALPRQLWLVFHGVDLILHAGDIYESSVLDELESIAPVLAAMGDDDGDDVAHDRRVKQKHMLTLGGITLWLAHNRYSYWNIGLEEAAASGNGPPDVIVFGHSHVAGIQTYRGVLVVNPGSPTFPRYRKELGTVGLLTIDGGKASARIVQLE